MNKPSLDIVLPCYNPITYWERNVIRCTHKIRQMLPETEIRLIVVNDGSHIDNLNRILPVLEQEIAGFRWISYPDNMGKGFALRKGIEASQSEFTIFTDIDFPYQEEGLIKIYQTLSSEGADIAVGVRSDIYYKDVPTERTVISKVFKNAAVKLLGLPISDTQCGLKGFNRKGREVFLNTHIKRYLFDVEFIYLAAQKKLNIQPVPVHIKDGIKFSKMNMKVLGREGLSFGMLLVKHYFNWFRKVK